MMNGCYEIAFWFIMTQKNINFRIDIQLRVYFLIDYQIFATCSWKVNWNLSLQKFLPFMQNISEPYLFKSRLNRCMYFMTSLKPNMAAILSKHVRNAVEKLKSWNCHEWYWRRHPCRRRQAIIAIDPPLFGPIAAVSILSMVETKRGIYALVILNYCKWYHTHQQFKRGNQPP